MIGTTLWGYCNGFFGRDSYSPKRVEALGVDWVVARQLDEEAAPEFASFDTPTDLSAYLTAWSSTAAKSEWSDIETP